MTIDDLIGHHQIRERLIGIARGMDDRDWGGLARIIAHDAIADFGGGMVEGSAAIIDVFRRFLDPCGPTQHLLGNLIVSIDGEQAESKCYVSDMHIGAGTRAHLTYCTLGDYHDRWQKRNGEWWLVQRMKHNRGFIGPADFFD